MQLKIYVAPRKDDGLIHMTQGRDARRVVVSRFNIWISRITPKDSLYDGFISSFLKGSNWTYRREMYEAPSDTRTSRFFQISASTEKVKHPIVMRTIIGR